MGIRWLEHSRERAAEAAAQGRVLLLLLAPSWSRLAEAWVAEVLARPDVALALEEGALCARVDVEAEPELAVAFDQGAWPSVVLIDGDGRPIWGGTWVEAPELLAALAAAVARVRAGPGSDEPSTSRQAGAHDAARSGPDQRVAPAPAPFDPGPPSQRTAALGDAALAVIERTLLTDFDPRFGGFGTGQKFPHPEVLDYALMRHVERRDPELSEILTKTLGAQVGGGLRDGPEGGFFRCCGERDWTRPHTGKTLDGNVALARVLIGAGLHLSRPELLGHGVAALSFVRRALRDPTTGLLFAGLAPDDGYYALAPAERLTRSRPRVDARLLTESNARAAMAFARAGVLLDDQGMTREGHALATALVRTMWRPGKGLVPLRDAGGDHPGDRLVDLAEVCLALLLVSEQSADRSLREPLDDLLDGMLARHVMASGDLGDRGADGRAECTLRGTAVGAQALLRAAALLGRVDCAAVARRALSRHAGDYRRHGDAMAAFGRALAIALRPPVRVVLVGDHDDDELAALRATACQAAVIERVAVSLDPALDGERLERLGLPAHPVPLAYVLRDREALGRTRRPDELKLLLARGSARRRASAPRALED